MRALVVYLCFLVPAVAAEKERRVRIVNLGNATEQSLRFADGHSIVIKVDFNTTTERLRAVRAAKTIVSEACGGEEFACEGVFVGANHIVDGMSGDVLVASCKMDPSAECPVEVRSLRERLHEDRVTMCIPTMRSHYLLESFRPYLDQYLDYYHRLGVPHAYIYGNVVPPKWMNSLRRPHVRIWDSASLTTRHRRSPGFNFRYQQKSYGTTVKTLKSMTAFIVRHLRASISCYRSTWTNF